MCDNMNEPWEHSAKWNKPVTERQILHDSIHVSYLKLMQSETGNGGQVLGGGRNEELLI